jgi:hypothetical protein
MSNVAVSFASLVKSNNGLFKSEKQAAFLLSQCQELNTFICGGDVYGNNFSLFYHCDAQGVEKVIKYLPQSGKSETVWLRHVVGTVNEVEAAKQAKEQKRLKREINRLKKAIEAREANRDSYKGAEALFEESQEQDKRDLQEYEAMLSSLAR